MRRRRWARDAILPIWTKPTLDNGIGPYRTSNIFQALLAQIGELNPDLASNVIVSGGRDADTARFRDALKPRRYIHAVSKNVTRFHNYVADIDAHTEEDALVFEITDCKFVDAGLKLHSSSNRIDRARKLRQEPVAGVFHDAAAVFRDYWLDSA